MLKTKSFLRREEHKALSGLTLSGKVLDIGGSKKSGYTGYIQGEHEIVTANIDAASGADSIFDAEKQWPVEDASFDAVLFMNVLEHLYNYENALDEAVRVLRPGGTIVGTVPFMFNVHGSPDDYFRYTKSALTRLLSERGLVDIRVQELGTGSFSVVYHCFMGFMRFNWIASLSMSACRAIDLFLAKVAPGNGMSPQYMPLGYYFQATRL